MKYFFFGVIFLFLTGCASTGSIYSSNTFVTDAAINELLAKEASEKIKETLPPGRTTLSLNDGNGFGLSLIDKLRDFGFAIGENGTEIKYILDIVTLENKEIYYRLLLDYDNRVFTRAYSYDGGNILALAAWSVKNGN